MRHKSPKDILSGMETPCFYPARCWWVAQISVLALTLVVATFVMRIAFSADNEKHYPEEMQALFLEKELDGLALRVQESGLKLDFLHDLRAHVIALGAEPFSVNVEPAELESDWNIVKQLVKSDQNYEDDEDVSDVVQQVDRALRKLLSPLEEIARRSITPIERRQEIYSDTPYERRFLSQLTTVGYNLAIEAYEEMARENSEWRNLLHEDFSWGHHFRRDHRTAVFDEVREHFQGINAILGDSVKSFSAVLAGRIKQVTQSAEERHLELIDEEMARVNRDIEGRKERLASKYNALEKLREREQERKEKEEERKSEIDRSLMYAVYGMIGVLLSLFIALKIFSDDVAKELINRRSLVEVIGMAFMLITIIILGTGEKLGSQVLGTLLGTIAGYIFARSIQRARQEGSS